MIDFSARPRSTVPAPATPLLVLLLHSLVVVVVFCRAACAFSRLGRCELENKGWHWNSHCVRCTALLFRLWSAHLKCLPLLNSYFFTCLSWKWKGYFFVILLLRCYRQPIDGFVWQRRWRMSGSFGRNQNNISCFGATFCRFRCECYNRCKIMHYSIIRKLVTAPKLANVPKR